jgi:hypothetical protein
MKCMRFILHRHRALVARSGSRSNYTARFANQTPQRGVALCGVTAGEVSHFIIHPSDFIL